MTSESKSVLRKLQRIPTRFWVYGIALALAVVTVSYVRIRREAVERLHRAITRNDLEQVKSCLKWVEIDAMSSGKVRYTPLIAAISHSSNGDETIVWYLLENGADWRKPDSNDYTPLHRAIHYGSVNIVKTLIDKGADVDSDAGGRCPIITSAVRRGNLEVVRLLVENGANVNATDQMGHTALFYLVNFPDSRNCSIIAEYLRKHGAEEPEIASWLRRETRNPVDGTDP